MLDYDTDFAPAPSDWPSRAITSYGLAVILIAIGALLIL